jgi:hypothetical protein
MPKNVTNRALRLFHARGKRANTIGAKRKNRGAGVWGTLENLGAETATARNRLMEARHFARLYDNKQLDALCSLGRKKGRPLSRLHVLQLIRVANARQRDALARKCSNESWSVGRLELEVRRLVPPRKYGGRKQSPPRSTDEALLVTEQLLSSLIRWDSVVDVSARLPKKVRTPLLEISKAAQGLCESIRNELDGSRPKRKER